jgi:hypothetical protein
MADEERRDIRSRVIRRTWENTQMKYKVFIDTNILLSGIFFEGNESNILDIVNVITAGNFLAKIK